MRRYPLTNRLFVSLHEPSFTGSFSTSPNAKLPPDPVRNPEGLGCRQIQLFGTILPKPLGCSGISNKPYEIRDHFSRANHPIPHRAHRCRAKLSGILVSACRRPSKTAK